MKKILTFLAVLLIAVNCQAQLKNKVDPTVEVLYLKVNYYKATFGNSKERSEEKDYRQQIKKLYESPKYKYKFQGLVRNPRGMKPGQYMVMMK